ncbi:MAG TPA: helix-turn-helix domain-containing protein [Acetobacteraceae bacterium]|jgi:DNA-binding transcriptional regulator YiaG|nr:helix-turn-helix domain-containing protein [Acetobacteraceae bacterium]
MSTNSELKARLARLGPIRDADPPPSFSGELVTLILRRDGKYENRISVAKRLRAAGLTLQAAHAVVTRLAEADLAVCRIAEGADISALARDLAPLDVRVYRRRSLGAAVIGEVRARHGLSQREFAEMLGMDVNTLQNWEQGRNKPDAATLNLVMAFDKAPQLIEQTAFEAVA